MISVIIPAHNEEKYLGACLESILKHRTPEVCDIIVVDNASTDGTIAVAEKFPSVTVIREPKKGPNSARQAGLQAARGDLCAFFDADTILPPGWFQKVQREFERKPKIVTLSAQYVLYDLPFISRTCIWYAMGISAYIVHFFKGRMLVGGNFVAKKSALLAIGGFNTALAHLGDETDLARRLLTVGPSVFSNRFFVYSSGRRLAKAGIFRTCWQYTMNFLWDGFFHKPFTKSFDDIR